MGPAPCRALTFTVFPGLNFPDLNVTGFLPSGLFGLGQESSPAKWGFFDGFYDFGDYSATFGHTHIVSTSVVNEFSGGIRRQDEGFGADNADEFQRRLVRANVGYTQGQFSPELNTLDMIPRVTIQNINSGGADFGSEPGGSDFGSSGPQTRKPVPVGAGGKRGDMDDEIPF